MTDARCRTSFAVSVPDFRSLTRLRSRSVACLKTGTRVLQGDTSTRCGFQHSATTPAGRRAFHSGNRREDGIPTCPECTVGCAARTVPCTRRRRSRRNTHVHACVEAGVTRAREANGPARDRRCSAFKKAVPEVRRRYLSGSQLRGDGCHQSCSIRHR